MFASLGPFPLRLVKRTVSRTFCLPAGTFGHKLSDVLTLYSELRVNPPRNQTNWLENINKLQAINKVVVRHVMGPFDGLAGRGRG